ncbi:MAG TPA: riboflavin kinase, partial [Chloroflexota bacterium]|nr:riboflavin kinase [Chloroflexota bacterium]
VSSSRIRGLLRDGQVAEAAILLGRPHRLSGPVVHGDRRGRTLGFATANVDFDERSCLPANGVYAVLGRIESGSVYPGVANLGIRPTFNGERRQNEIHLIGFEGNIYGERLEVDFVARLRGERRFDSAEALIGQVAEDMSRARSILATRFGDI